MSGFIESFRNNFATRFDDFRSEVMGIVKEPFCVSDEAGEELVPSLDKQILHLLSQTHLLSSFSS